MFDGPGYAPMLGGAVLGRGTSGGAAGCGERLGDFLRLLNNFRIARLDKASFWGAEMPNIQITYETRLGPVAVDHWRRTRDAFTWNSKSPGTPTLVGIHHRS